MYVDSFQKIILKFFTNSYWKNFYISLTVERPNHYIQLRLFVFMCCKIKKNA